jgi:hypothetical protein
MQSDEFTFSFMPTIRPASYSSGIVLLAFQWISAEYRFFAHIHEIPSLNFNRALLFCLLLIPGNVVICSINEGYTNTGCQVTVLTKFCTLESATGCQNNISLGTTVPEGVE